VTGGPQGADPISVLFVCTGNSARSQLAEAVLRARGGAAFTPRSAGTEPKGVHPLTLRVLVEAGVDSSGLTSKSVQGLVNERFDHVVTVCDQARESCPVFPNARHSTHWDLDDPAAVGSEEDRLGAFRQTLSLVTAHVDAFIREVRPEAARG